MKKKITVCIILVLVVSCFIATGFRKNPNVELINYKVSADGSEITFDVAITNSIGYTRGYKDNGGGLKPHYLDFYNTFGFINSSLGAKHTFILKVDKEDKEIYFNREDKGYELVLVKDETGQWKKE